MWRWAWASVWSNEAVSILKNINITNYNSRSLQTEGGASLLLWPMVCSGLLVANYSFWFYQNHIDFVTNYTMQRMNDTKTTSYVLCPMSYVLHPGVHTPIHRRLVSIHHHDWPPVAWPAGTRCPPPGQGQKVGGVAGDKVVPLAPGWPRTRHQCKLCILLILGTLGGAGTHLHWPRHPASI